MNVNYFTQYFIIFSSNMNYCYSSLPSEIKGRINLELSYDVLREFKYINKDVFYSTRYLTCLKNRIVYLKNLFIKNNVDNNTIYTQFYYNLTCIKNKLFVSNDKDELLLASRIIKQLNYVKIAYSGANIDDTFSLIKSFTDKKTSLNVNKTREYMHVGLNTNRYRTYTIKRKNGLIVADIMSLNTDTISNYLHGVDSLLIDEYGDYSSYLSTFVKILQNTKIHTVHFEDIHNFDVYSKVIQYLDTLYINVQYTETENDYDNEIIHASITKVVFQNILISNESKNYQKYSRIFPNATIEVYNFNKNDIIRGSNIVVSEDNLRVTKLSEQRLCDLLIDGGCNVARFPNLREISTVVVGVNEYENSMEMIKVAIRKISRLNIIVQSEIESLSDILKYVDLMDCTVSKYINVCLNYNNNVRHVCDFYRLNVGLSLDIREQSNSIDVSYISRRDDIIFNMSCQNQMVHSNFFHSLNITKINLHRSLFSFINDLHENIKIIYISGVLPPIMNDMKENNIIEHIFFDEEENMINVPRLKIIFPRCTIHLIDSIY